MFFKLQVFLYFDHCASPRTTQKTPAVVKYSPTPSSVGDGHIPKVVTFTDEAPPESEKAYNDDQDAASSVKVQPTAVDEHIKSFMVRDGEGDVAKQIESELRLQAQLDGFDIDQSIAKFCIIKPHRVSGRGVSS